MRLTADGAWAVAGDKALNAARRELQSNARLVASTLLDPVMFTIPTRASWGRASWRTAAGDLRASWGAACWTCDCSGSAGTNLARASWGRASWNTFFGDIPSDYGELRGGTAGATRRGASLRKAQE